MVYAVRFWNIADENIKVGGKYMYEFDTFENAWEAANTLLVNAYKCGAVEMDIDGTFFPIVED